ncbi:MAG: hypothetical protein R2824_15190 [Saprospiraceae bacterium]
MHFGAKGCIRNRIDGNDTMISGGTVEINLPQAIVDRAGKRMPELAEY